MHPHLLSRVSIPLLSLLTPLSFKSSFHCFNFTRLLATLDATAHDGTAHSTAHTTAVVPRRSKAVRWSEEEDASLILLVAKHGASSWTTISSKLVGRSRTLHQCRNRWTKALDPSVTKGEWSDEEDTSLRTLVGEHGTASWTMISSELAGGTRTDAQCRTRWMLSLDPSVTKGEWSREEDASLRALVAEHGTSSWAMISSKLVGGTRTGIRCRQRWTHALDLSVTKGEWSREEDESLRALVSEHGTSSTQSNSWALIASKLVGGTRTGKQCYEHWTCCTDPSINFGEWSEDETAILYREHSNTPGKWATIAQALPGRTRKLVKAQYLALTGYKQRKHRASPP